MEIEVLQPKRKMRSSNKMEIEATVPKQTKNGKWKKSYISLKIIITTKSIEEWEKNSHILTFFPCPIVFFGFVVAHFA